METYWYPVETYQSRSSGLLPLRLSYLYGCEDHDVLDSIRTTNGTAMWTNKTGAIFSGLCELIERDAFFIRYLSRKTQTRISVSVLNKQTADMIRYITKYRLEVNLFNISLEFNIPVVLCIIVDRSGVGPAISIGAKCSKDPDHAVLHALLEAVQIRFFSRMIKLRSESGLETSNMDKRSLSWYGIENIDKLDFFLDSREYSKPSEFIGTARSFLDNFVHDIFVSDVTLPGLDDLFVAKVNVPQLLPLYFFDEHKPIYSDRVQRYLQDVKLNEDPHPFM